MSGQSPKVMGGSILLIVVAIEYMNSMGEEEQKRLEKEKRRLAFAATKTVVQKEKLNKTQRRELQEKQRLEKLKSNPVLKPKPSLAKPSSDTKPVKRGNIQRTVARKSVELFSHLPQYEKESSLTLKVNPASQLHPAIVCLGLKYHDNVITGSSARAVAMLTSFKEVINDYETPENQTLSRDLDRHLKPMIQFLIHCRPHSITMGNAIKHVRHAITGLSFDLNESQAKESLLDVIDNYLQTRIVLAQQQIVKIAGSKISEGDTILTFGRSHVVEQTLINAHREGLKFKVVIVNARPRNEGELLVKRLAEEGIDCAFILLTSMSYVMESVSKVFLGACSLMSNGAMVGRAGTASVAMMAKAFNKPVLVLAARHKFTEKVQLDSITNNELANPDELILPLSEENRSCLYDWRDIPNMNLLNLNYDLTPQEFITMIISEFGMIPPSSVPVIVREKE